ncbi:tetratricopeptide repeat protein [Hydromonas duriensis]|uniref:Sel1 repeat-containing protein n=1 Tax=Hydromonas duriensis TaxID=1527608 RepID=A0A4V3DJM8_9BURK|nr:tetratricopeptide repeat protein [Hydromonas duriensis]TDR30729.1 Sel1 repeat-containing protein [Hydromonas duriensis]
MKPIKHLLFPSLLMIMLFLSCQSKAETVKEDNCQLLAIDNNTQLQRYQIAECFFEKEDYSAALPYYEQLANEGYAKAENSLGFYYQFGVSGKGIDYPKAMSLYKSAANKGVSDAMVGYGGFFLRGDGVKKNYKTALFWFEKAAKLNDPNGLYSLGVMYQNGLGVAKKDMKKARFFWKQAADLGDKLALFMLTNAK